MVNRTSFPRLIAIVCLAVASLMGTGRAVAQSLDDLRRQGVDVSNPQAVMAAARQLGWTDAQIQTALLQGRSQTTPQQSPARPTTTAAQGSGQQATERIGSVPKADSTALLPQLLEMPQITPSPLKLETETGIVTVLITLDGTAESLAMKLIGPYGSEVIEARRIDKVSVSGGRAGESGRQMSGYQAPANQPQDNLYGEQGRQTSQGTRETWLGTIFIPPTTISGVWTLALSVKASGSSREINPAAVLRIDSEHARELSYFGYNTFRNVPDAFRPGVMGPVNDGYVVGPNDELRLTVWGAAEFQYDLPVDAEGRIYVPKVGQLTVAGRRVDELRRDVRIWLSRSYAGLVDEPPSVMMDLTITRLRPLQIFVLGEVEQPGGYEVPSGSSIFNALYSVGGPLARGSLRQVRVIRGDHAAEVDLYDYLLKGYKADAVQLQTGDNVFIPPRGKTVSIEGAVKRPAMYEMKEEESFADLLSFAGGLKAEAYSKRFQIERIIPFSKRQDPTRVRTVLDLDLTDVLSGREGVRLEDGDRVRIFSINEEEDPAIKSAIPAVYVEGAVYKPGQYELGPTLQTVRDLVEHADGLTGAAYMDKAELVRIDADLQREILSLDLAKVMEDIPTQNLVLRPQDSLRVYSTLEMRGDRKVAIAGKVLDPGRYPYYEGMTIRDLLFRGGGLADPEYLKEVFLERADLFRRSPDGGTERIVPFDLAAALNGRGMSEERLLPEDSIRVYPAEVEQLRDRIVTISGAVKKPGEFRYRDGMSIEDLILQAGGFSEDAYRDRVEVTRAIVTMGTSTERAQRIEVPLSPNFSFADFNEEDYPLASLGSGVIPADSSLRGAGDFDLQHRDRVYVRAIPDFKEQETVVVTGEVRFPGEYTLLHQNETLGSVLRRAGGPLPSAYVRGGRLIREGEPVIVEMNQVLSSRRGSDVIMMAGDSVHIPLQPNTVAVRGNVANEGLLKYRRGERVSYYLNRAGGLQEDTEAILLTQASGATFKLKRHVFGILPRRNPVVDEGATITAVIKPPAEQGPIELRDVTDRLTDITAILSTTVTLLVLSRELTK